MAIAGRVGIALDDAPYEPSPTWTWIDQVYPNLVRQIDFSTGRQTESDITETGTASVVLNDTSGLFDPFNTLSVFHDKVIGKAIQIGLRNPVNSTWYPQWRGVIDDPEYLFDPSGRITTVTLNCVDIMDYLASVRMIPGLFGDTPPAGAEGIVFYEDGPVKVRTEQLLADASVDPAMSVVFDGNVDVQETRYDPEDSIRVALRDTADAEFPTIANDYVDKIGRYVWHGRKARFDPEGTEASATPGSWNFTRWKAGDAPAIAFDANRALIFPPLQWGNPRSRVFNAALCWPRGILEADIPGQIYTDPVSITAYGYRSWPMTDLIIQSGTTTGNTANEECLLYSTWKVENYKQPLTRVEAVTFASVPTSSSYAAKTWALIVGAEISDVINLQHNYANDAFGTSNDYFVEGYQMTILPAAPAIDNVSVTYNISPASQWADDVFTGEFGGGDASGGGGPSGVDTSSYDAAIDYSAEANRPAFTATSTHNFTNQSQLESALASFGNTAGHEFINTNSTGGFAISGEWEELSGLRPTGIGIKIDFGTDANRVRWTGTTLHSNLPAIFLHDSSNMQIYGGLIENDGGTGLLVMGGASAATQNIRWWNLEVQNTGSHGIAMLPTNPSGGGSNAANTIQNFDIQAEVSNWGTDDATLDGHPETGTGIHGVLLADVDDAGAFKDNTIAVHVHDGDFGAGIEMGQDGVQVISGNNFYILAENLNFVATSQVAANAIQFWGDTTQSNNHILYLEANNLQGRAVDGNGGSDFSGNTVDYARATNTNQNPNLGSTEPGVSSSEPYDDRQGIVYVDVA